ncbi:MAG: DUF421 domain-containing protein [Bacillota bacterium]
MIIIFIRTLLLYIFVLISMRLMGKGELAEMQPFELVVTLMIAELAALPMENMGVPLLNGLIAISTLIFAQVVISFINMKSEKARGIICGKPSILIHKGKINEEELRRLRITINDLVEQVRSKDYPSISDVEFAILETNGDLSIIPKTSKKNVTIEDLQGKTSYEGLPISLIIDGHINYENLSKADKTEDWLMHQLNKNGINHPREVLFSYVDGSNNFFVQKKEKKE